MVPFDELQLVCMAGYFLHFSFKSPYNQIWIQFEWDTEFPLIHMYYMSSGDELELF